MVFMFLLMLQPAYPAMILDQSQENQDATLGISNTVQLAQTFTGSVTGNLELVSLFFTEMNAGGNPDISSSKSEPITVSITETTNGAPNTTVIWSRTYSTLGFLLPSTTRPMWLDVRMSAPVTAGATYAIVLTRTGTTIDRWYANKNGAPGNYPDYAGGSAYQNTGTGWTKITLDGGAFTNIDACFEVYTVPIPEPTTLTLIIMASLCFIIVRKKRLIPS